MKKDVKRVQIRVEEEWGRKLAENLKEKNKMFCEKVNEARRRREERAVGVRMMMISW